MGYQPTNYYEDERNMRNEYTFYFDPSHAWLAVPLQEFLDSGAEVSRYSYVCTERGMVYLEEDLDAKRFLDAKGLIGKDGRLTDGTNIEDSFSNSSSWIRRLPSITLDSITKKATK